MNEYLIINLKIEYDLQKIGQKRDGIILNRHTEPTKPEIIFHIYFIIRGLPEKFSTKIW